MAPRSMLRWLTVGLAAGLVALVMAAPAGADHAWSNYHWARTASQQAGGFDLKVVDSMTSAWDPYLGIAVSDWSASAVLDLVTEAGATDTSTRKKCPAPTGKVRACNAEYGFNGWLGLAQIWVNSSSHIVKGLAKMNDSYFNLSKYNTPAWRQFVVCQEPGHTLGLGHQDEIFNNANLGSCMDYTNDPGGESGNLSNLHPNRHDYDQLATIYSHHTDSTTTIASSTGSSGPGKGNGKGQIPGEVDEHGLPVWAGPAHGNQYEVDLGNGVRLITHVIWVERGLPGAR